MIRNQPLLWVLSIGFELTEVSSYPLLRNICVLYSRFQSSSEYICHCLLYLVFSADFSPHVAKFQRVLVGQHYS